MRVSTKGRYGLRAMIDMAQHMHQAPVSIKTIAERQNISESYLEQVFSTLKKGGLIRSSRGSCGGYSLSVPPGKITAGQVIKILEGSLSPVFCVDDPDCGGSGGICGREKTCPAYPFWFELNRLINDYIENITIEELADREKKAGRSSAK